MLDTIIYIPTILAYAFITLLVVILGFIVIYVSHKIYISVYDNLPVPATQSSETLSKDSSMEKHDGVVFMERTSANSILTQHALRKSKTALRIVVTFQTCYLAYVVFEMAPKKILAKPKPASVSIITIPKEVKYCEHCGNVKENPENSIASINNDTKTNSCNNNNEFNNNNEHNSDNNEHKQDNNEHKENFTEHNNDNNEHNNANNEHEKDINEHYNSHKDISTNTNEDENCINSTGSGVTVATFGSSVTSLGPHKLIKYFDRLTNIPHGGIMKACPKPGKQFNVLSSEILRPDMHLLSNAYDIIAKRR